MPGIGVRPSWSADSAPPGNDDLKAKIEATEKARDELMRRFQAESAKKSRADSKRDEYLRKLSGTVCSECGADHRKVRRPSAPPLVAAPGVGNAVPERDDSAPEDPEGAGDVY
jgi:hypothetical protein